jgi:hypothetical protein
MRLLIHEYFRLNMLPIIGQQCQIRQLELAEYQIQRRNLIQEHR